MAVPRRNPYVWVTWLSGLLSGDKSCEWAAWFKAHNTYAKRPSDFDFNTWRIDHTALLCSVRDEYRQKGFQVTVEEQNSFRIDGRVGTLAGKPDLIAVKDDAVIVIDTKTGQPRASDITQLKIYMWALPIARPNLFGGRRIDGLIAYRNNRGVVLADEVDELFAKRLKEKMMLICGNDPPPTSPSVGECRFCDISSEDCKDRIEGLDVEAVSTDEF